MAPIDTDYFAKLGRWDQLNRAADAQVEQDPNLSQRLGAYGNHFPWMDPSAMWSLAKAGIDPLHPAAQAAASSAAQLKVASGAGYGTVNGKQTPPSQSEIPNVLNGLTGINDDLERIKNQSNAATPPPMTYAAPPQSQIQMLMGTKSNVKGLGLQKTSWDLLPQDVRDQLRQVTITPASVNDLPVVGPSTDPNNPPGVAHPQGLPGNSTDEEFKVFRINGTNGLSPTATGVLGRVLNGVLEGAQPIWSGPTGYEFVSIPNRPNTPTDVGPLGPVGGGVDPISTVTASALPSGGASTGLNAFIRTSGMVMGAPLQEVQGQVRNAYQLAVNQERPNLLESQSDLGIALGDIAQGKKADTGEGFFVDPNSGVAQERERRALERGNIYGHAVTLGRVAGAAVNEGVADVTGYHVMEPGTLQYNLLSGVLDAAVALKGDPTAKAFGYLGDVNKARGTIQEAGSVSKAIQAVKEGEGASGALSAFQAAGGVNGIRRTVSRDAADAFLTSPEGSKFAAQTAAIDDPYTIWNAAKDRRGVPQMMPQTAKTLAETSDPGNVSLYLRDQLGPVIKDAPSFSRGTQRSVASTVLGDPMANVDGSPLVLAKTPNRWTSMMPSGALLDTNDLQNAAVQLERGASLMETPDEVFRDAFKTLAGATSPKEVENAFSTILKDASDRLTTKFMQRIKLPNPTDEADVARYNLEAAEAKKNARSIAMMRDNPVGPDGVYAAHAVGTGQGQMGQQMVVDGIPVVITDNKPIILGQTLGGKIPMPNWRALRTNLSDADRLLTNPVVNAADHLAMAGQTIWKGVQIMTIKTMVKVLADEQAAIAARGYDSFINHPLQAMGVILATPLSELPTDAGLFTRIRHAEVRSFRWAAEKVPGVDEHLTTMPFDETFAHVDKMKIASTGGWDKFMDTRGAVHADRYEVLIRRPGENDLEFLNEHARNFAQYIGSEDARGFARAESLQAAKDSYWDGPLKNARLDFARQESLPELGADAVDRAASDAHVEHVMEQMQYVTNGNPKLMDAIRTGKLEGTPVFKPRPDGSASLARGYVQRLTNFSDDFPQVTIAQKAINVGDPKRQVLDAMFGRAISMLLSTPSAVLSKSPLFRQAYWQHLIDNSTYMSDEARTAFMDAAQDTNLTNTLQKRLDSTVARIGRSTATSPGTLSFEDADNLAKSYALQIVQRTTHDFTDRSQFFDAIRLLTPFGDVWRKTLQRWGNIIAENPAVVRRFQQGFEQARSTGMGETMGQPAGQGFFHQDNFGQEVFTIPGTEFANQAITGVPVPLTGNVQGLSLGTEFFPALGPVASIPVAWTMEKLHLMNQQTPLGRLGEVIFPYGPPSTDVGSILDGWNYAPTWLKTAFGKDRQTSPDDVRVYNNVIKGVIAYGVSNGDYDMTTTAGVAHAVEDASGKTATLFHVRGALQFFVPGAPAPELLVKDKGGKLLDLDALIGDYSKLQQQQDKGLIPDAQAAFLDKYGPDLFRAITPKSYASVFGIPTSHDSAQWVDDHPDLRRDFPHIYGYFAPPSDPNDFDYNAYLQQINRGERVSLTPEQWAKLSNARLAGIQYGRAKDKVNEVSGGKPTDQQKAWLATVKQNLIDEYPGYEDALYGGSGLPGRPEARLLVDEAKKAVSDPTVQSTDAGRAMKTYLAQREKVDQEWIASGYKTGSWGQSTNDYAVQIRAYLRKLGGELVKGHPQFDGLFSSVFDREMRDDALPVQGAGG